MISYKVYKCIYICVCRFFNQANISSLLLVFIPSQNLTGSSDATVGWTRGGSAPRVSIGFMRGSVGLMRLDFTGAAPRPPRQWAVSPSYFRRFVFFIASRVHSSLFLFPAAPLHALSRHESCKFPLVLNSLSCSLFIVSQASCRCCNHFIMLCNHYVIYLYTFFSPFFPLPTFLSSFEYFCPSQTYLHASFCAS